MKKRKASIKRSRVFQRALKGGDNRNVTWEIIWPFNASAVLKITFSKHWLIKISMTCAYIKPEGEKNDTTAMNTATNEACIGWWDENCYLMKKA